MWLINIMLIHYSFSSQKEDFLAKRGLRISTDILYYFNKYYTGAVSVGGRAPAVLRPTVFFLWFRPFIHKFMLILASIYFTKCVLEVDIRLKKKVSNKSIRFL